MVKIVVHKQTVTNTIVGMSATGCLHLYRTTARGSGSAQTTSRRGQRSTLVLAPGTWSPRRWTHLCRWKCHDYNVSTALQRGLITSEAPRYKDDTIYRWSCIAGLTWRGGGDVGVRVGSELLQHEQVVPSGLTGCHPQRPYGQIIHAFHQLWVEDDGVEAFLLDDRRLVEDDREVNGGLHPVPCAQVRENRSEDSIYTNTHSYHKNMKLS